MAVIKTKRNFVCAYEPQDGDCMVETLIGPGAGGGGTLRRLTVQHIGQYQQAVDWAVSMADQFEHPIHIVPIDVTDFASLHRERLKRGVALMTPEELHQLRRDVVFTCAEVMRDCDDPTIRADAYSVLVKMGAVG